MVQQPDFVTPEMVEGAGAALATRKPVAGLELVRLANLEEGLSAQVLHIGPSNEERPTIARLHDFIADQGKLLAGKHHEIYLSDPRRTAPEKLKTILRQPVQ